MGSYSTIDGTQIDLCGINFALISGTIYDGTWQWTCAVPASAKYGHYEAHPFAYDILGNDTQLTSADPLPGIDFFYDIAAR